MDDDLVQQVSANKVLSGDDSTRDGLFSVATSTEQAQWSNFGYDLDYDDSPSGLFSLASAVGNDKSTTGYPKDSTPEKRAPEIKHAADDSLVQ